MLVTRELYFPIEGSEVVQQIRSLSAIYHNAEIVDIVAHALVTVNRFAKLSVNGLVTKPKQTWRFWDKPKINYRSLLDKLSNSNLYKDALLHKILSKTTFTNDHFLEVFQLLDYSGNDTMIAIKCLVIYAELLQLKEKYVFQHSFKTTRVDLYDTTTSWLEMNIY
jgi:hypothetical protein